MFAMSRTVRLLALLLVLMATAVHAQRRGRMRSTAKMTLCSQLQPFRVNLQQFSGVWLAQEEMPFVENMSAEERRNLRLIRSRRAQKQMCASMNVTRATPSSADLAVTLRVGRTFTKTFPGTIRLQRDGSLLLNNELMDGTNVMLAADPGRYFALVECVAKTGLRPRLAAEDVAVYTRTPLPAAEMELVWQSVERIMKVSRRNRKVYKLGQYCTRK